MRRRPMNDGEMALLMAALWVATIAWLASWPR